MSHTEPSAQISSHRAGILASLRSSHRRGTGALSHLLALGCAALAIAVFLPISAASADGRIGSNQGLFEGAAGSLEFLGATAVSEKEDGAIYVSDGGNGRIAQFEPNGSWVQAFGWGVVPGAATGTGNLISGSTSVSAVALTSGAFARGQVITGPGIPLDTLIEFFTPTELALSKAVTATTLGATLTVAAGPGNVSANEDQRLTISATSGLFSLSFASPNPGSTASIVGNSLIATTSAGSPTVSSVSAIAGTGTITKGSSEVQELTNPETFTAGQAIVGSGIPANTTVTRVAGSTLQLSAEATASATGVDLTVPASLSAGLTVSGPGISPATTILSVAPNGNLTLSANATASNPAARLSAGVPYDATATEVQSALEGLSNIGTGDVSVSGGPGDATGTSPYSIEFKGRYSDTNVRPLTAVNLNLSGGSPSSQVAISTAREGAGVLEACTTVCVQRRIEEGAGESDRSAPGQLRGGSEAIAIDNNEHSESYGDLYAVDAENYRVEKYSPGGEFLLMFGGEVDKGPHHPGNVCTAEYLAEGDVCGAGTPGNGPSQFNEAWSHTRSNSIAVGPDGTVYVGDYGRIQEFQPNGSFAGEFKLPDAQPLFVTALAVDSVGDIYERSEVFGCRPGGVCFEEMLSQVHGVREFSPAHVLLHTFDAEKSSSEPTHIALDSAGNLVVSESKESQAGTPPSGDQQPFFVNAGFVVYSPTGELVAEISSEQVQSQEYNSEGAYHLSIGNPRGIAIGNAAGSIYAASSIPEGPHIAVLPLPAPGPPIVGKEHVTDVQPKTATLHAFVNPSEFNTSYHFEFIDDAHFQSEGFASPATESTGTVPLGLVERNDPVQAAISGLSTATKYHYRVVAESSYEGATTVYGPGETFETLPAVSVRNFTTMIVAPGRVQFKAELNPNGSPGAYRIKIGKSTSYGEGTSEGTLPISNEFEKVTVEFNNLQPNTVYHYQLESENGYTEGGVLKTDDQTFATELSTAEEFRAEDCPNGSHHGEANSTLREENNSLALPDCRAYEQVTEASKEGGEAFASWSLAPSGERAMYLSGGAFAGAEANEFTSIYLAQRTESGWATMPVVKRVGPKGTEPSMTPVEDTFSPELDRWLYMESPAIDHLQQFFESTNGYLTEGFANGTFIPQASPRYELQEGEPRPYYETLKMDQLYRSDDLSRLFFVTNARLLPAAEDPRPDGYAHGSLASQSDRIYEFKDVGGATPSMHLIAEIPLSMTTSVPGFVSNGCSLNLDTTNARSSEYARSTSIDGSTIVYSGPVVNEPTAEKCGPGTPNPVALFTHYEGQSVSHQLNAVRPSQCHSGSPCASGAIPTPEFAGLSEDGNRAWFSTSQSLIDSDTDTSGDLYLAELEHGEVENLVQVSLGEANSEHPTPGSGAGVAGGVRLSPDGSHAAFVATGVLTTAPNADGESAAAGAQNLYVYDADTGVTKFVAQLCAPASEQEAGEECGGGVPGQLAFTPSGAHLVFASRSRLTADDTDDASDIYRYDFQTGNLIRVSFGRRGNDGNGNDNHYVNEFLGAGGIGDANRLAEDSNRAISADGSIVIFSTSAPLVSRDTNEAFDVYEWEEDGHGTCTEPGGCISLVSDGVDPHGAGGNGVISASGRDITFQTQRGESPGDTDGVGDIYDARVDGGFPYAQPAAPCGSPEACRPSPTAPPGAPNFTSEVNVSGGNGQAQLECAKGRHKVKKHGQVRCVPNGHRKHKQRKHHQRAHKRHTQPSRNHGGAR